MPATRQATSTIPLVFVVVGDAGAQQIVPNFARPDSNIAGFTSNELTMAGKRLQLLREMSSETACVLYVTNVLLGTGTGDIVEHIKMDAVSVGVFLVDGAVSSSEEITAAIEAFGRESRGGIVVAFNAFTTVHRAQIIALAARHRLPTIYPLRVFADDGGLISYGFNQDDQFRRSASYIDRILKGEKACRLAVHAAHILQSGLPINPKNAYHRVSSGPIGSPNGSWEEHRAQTENCANEREPPKYFESGIGGCGRCRYGPPLHPHRQSRDNHDLESPDFVAGGRWPEHLQDVGRQHQGENRWRARIQAVRGEGNCRRFRVD